MVPVSLLLLIQPLQEKRAQENGHIPGLGQVPGIGRQVRVLGFAQGRIQEQARSRVKADLFREIHTP